MVSYHGSNWSDQLSTIEFAHATLVNKSTQLSPFELGTGRKGNNAIIGESNEAVTKIGLFEYAKKFADRRQKVIELAQKNLENAQAKQKEYYNSKRSSVTFKSADMVMLDDRHLNLRHRNNGQDTTNSKLAAKKIGPFKIEKLINQNVAKLTLPRALIKLHRSFNIELLSYFVPNPVRFSSRPVPKAVPVVLDEATGDELHIVEALVKKRIVSRRPEWLVRWHGLPEHGCTWKRKTT